MEVLLSEPQKKPVVDANSKSDKLLKRCIWAYFLLVIFEGAFRKWFLPGLASPLLIIRDPIALWVIYESWKRNLFPSTIYLKGMVILGAISIYTACFTGHGNLLVALFGARVFLIHIPFMFIIGRVLSREDLLKMGKVTLCIGIPMAILISMQFYSPQSAWVNRGVAGDMAGAGFDGSGDFKRPPGTFSFINGTSLFFGWLAPFVLYFWFNIKKVNIWLLIGASGALLLAIPFSISRFLSFEVTATFAFAILASLRKPENIGKVLLAIVTGIVCVYFLSQTTFFTTATGAFTDRFTTANESQGGLVDGVFGKLVLGALYDAVNDSVNQPFWGYGVGMGTNVGSQLLSGERQFLISEGEWGRIIGEMGALMGLIVIALRVGLTFKITASCYKKLTKGDLLPWLLLSYGFVNIIQGGWAQPTSLGFYTMIGGALLTALGFYQKGTAQDIQVQ